MSLDFDSAGLQTQQDEEEYDQEDYAREQEVQAKPPRPLRCEKKERKGERGACVAGPELPDL